MSSTECLHLGGPGACSVEGGLSIPGGVSNAWSQRGSHPTPPHPTSASTWYVVLQLHPAPPLGARRGGGKTRGVDGEPLNPNIWGGGRGGEEKGEVRRGAGKGRCGQGRVGRGVKGNGREGRGVEGSGGEAGQGKRKREAGRRG